MKKFIVLCMLLAVASTAFAYSNGPVRMYYRCTICGVTTAAVNNPPNPGYCFSNGGGPHNWVRYG